MNDVRTLDERARNASAALRTAAARRPEPAEPPRAPERRTAWLAAAAVIVAVALVAGVLAVRHEQNRASVTRPTGTTRWPATLAARRATIETGTRVWVVGDDAVQLVGRTPAEPPRTFPVPWTITGATVDGDTLYVTGGTPGRVRAFTPNGAGKTWTLSFANPGDIAVVGNSIFLSDTNNPGLWELDRGTGRAQRRDVIGAPDFGIATPSRPAPANAPAQAITQLASVDGRVVVIATTVQRGAQWTYIVDAGPLAQAASSHQWYSSNAPFGLAHNGTTMWTVHESSVIRHERRGGDATGPKYWSTDSVYALPFNVTRDEVVVTRAALFVRHGNDIARVDRVTSTLDEFRAPLAKFSAWTADASGRLWFTDGRGNLVSIYDPGASTHGRVVCASGGPGPSCAG